MRFLNFIVRIRDGDIDKKLDMNNWGSDSETSKFFDREPIIWSKNKC